MDGVEYTLTPKVPVEPKVVQRFIDIEVYPEDAPEAMTWDQAMTWCQNLGDGWRLPDRQELLALYEQRDIIGDFGSGYYWSSSEDGSSYVWGQYFYDGNQYGNYKDGNFRVRAVRDTEAGR